MLGAYGSRLLAAFFEPSTDVRRGDTWILLGLPGYFWRVTWISEEWGLVSRRRDPLRRSRGGSPSIIWWSWLSRIVSPAANLFGARATWKKRVGLVPIRVTSQRVPRASNHFWRGAMASVLSSHSLNLFGRVGRSVCRGRSSSAWSTTTVTATALDLYCKLR